MVPGLDDIKSGRQNVGWMSVLKGNRPATMPLTCEGKHRGQFSVLLQKQTPGSNAGNSPLCFANTGSKHRELSPVFSRDDLPRPLKRGIDPQHLRGGRSRNQARGGVEGVEALTSTTPSLTKVAPTACPESPASILVLRSGSSKQCSSEPNGRRRFLVQANSRS